MSFDGTTTPAVGDAVKRSDYVRLRDNDNLLKTSVDNGGNLAPTAASTITIATGAAVPTQNLHYLDTEGAAATDDLDTLTVAGNIRSGHRLTLRMANSARVPTVKDGTGNISLDGGDFTLSTPKSAIDLWLDGATWRKVGSSSASAFAPNDPVLVGRTRF